VFAWDARKALANLHKHGVSFEEAATVFADPDALEWEDPPHSEAERRSKRLGRSLRGRVLILVYTLRRTKMARKRSALSSPARRAARSAEPMPDGRIDFSDIPESTPEELKRARRVAPAPQTHRPPGSRAGRSPGRPKTGRAKQLIAIRIAPRLLAQLRRLAAKQSKPYQTLIHELLERAAKHAA
jgi:uncharacterized DUF497 family protein